MIDAWLTLYRYQSEYDALVAKTGFERSGYAVSTPWRDGLWILKVYYL